MIFMTSPFTPHTKQWNALYSSEIDADLFVSPWNGHRHETHLPRWGFGGVQSGKYRRIS